MTNDLSGFPVAQDDQNDSHNVVGKASTSPIVPRDDNTLSQVSSQADLQPPEAIPAQPAQSTSPIVFDKKPDSLQMGGMAKEQMDMPATFDKHEKVPVVEMRESEAVPEEVSSWMEKLEQGEDIQLPQPVTHDDQVLVSNSGQDVNEDKIVLPMTQEEVQLGLHQKVYSGARWLAEWCIKLVKKFHGKVVYRVNQAGVSNESR